MGTEKKNSLIEIFTEAISIEIYGQEYYSIFSDLIPERSVKAVFLKLSDDEAEHKRIISNEYEKLSGIPIEIDILESENRVKARSIFPESLEPLDINTANDVLHLGIRTEDRSILLYSRGEEMSDGQVKDMFRRLVHFEEGHREKLQKALDHLVKKGTWKGLRIS